MSIVHPEKLRCCKRCGHQWYAQQYGRLDTGFVISRRQADLRREQYRSCPSCGSTKIRTFSGRTQIASFEAAKPGKERKPTRAERKGAQRVSDQRLKALGLQKGDPLPAPTPQSRAS